MTTTPSISKETMESVYTKMNEFLASLSDDEREVVGMALQKTVPEGEGEDVEGYFGLYTVVSGGQMTNPVLSWYTWCLSACPVGTNYNECVYEHWCVPQIN